MKNYKIIVDGYTIGIMEFNADEVKALEADKDIRLEEV